MKKLIQLKNTELENNIIDEQMNAIENTELNNIIDDEMNKIGRIQNLKITLLRMK